ncbi:MAG: nucleotidyltransferase [Candidatus Gastranaerophilales bacterium]|nr:nucleotidyltransferase [Candidatus Gastranaerophilales bacterium]
MKVNGIIAEYNPFHNGHLQHMLCARRRNKADYTIIAMSGNFVQRGAPALIDKYDRARMALSCGADLVLEIPACYAASSAEFFATGAVSLLDKLGVVTHLCFGSECGDIKLLSKIAQIFLQEPAGFRIAMQDLIKQGQTYPSARTWALLQYDPSLSAHKDVLSMPNNILGIEYVKSLICRDSNMIPDTTPRVGSDYHDKRLGINQSSALAIRQAILSGQDKDTLAEQIPQPAWPILAEALDQKSDMKIDDFSGILHYKLLAERESGYTKYLDVSEALSDRIRNHLYEFESFGSFCERLKSKEMTYARISRCLSHILLDIQTQDLERFRELDHAPYARVLGFRKSAAPLLTAIKEHTSIPFVTKLADADKELSAPAMELLKKELYRSELYYSVLSVKNRTSMRNEYSTPLVILED